MAPLALFSRAALPFVTQIPNTSPDTVPGMTIKDTCDDCTDEKMCRRHLLIGVAAVALETAPTRGGFQ